MNKDFRSNLRKKFEDEYDICWQNEDGEPDIDYVYWLEKYLYKVLPEDERLLK
jgi:hypothetical protein